MSMMPRRRASGTRRVAYSQFGLQVLAVSIVAHVLQIVTQTTYPLLFIVNIAALFYLRARATRYIRSGRADFDAVIAAEMMVAFGVLSLILGITSAVLPLFLGSVSLRVDDLSALATLAVPFLEGLATAGLAPFFAVLLRIEAHEVETSFDTSVDMSNLATATRDLTREVRAAFNAIRQLQESAQDATVATHLLADEVRGDAGKLSRAFEAGEMQLKSLGISAETSSAEVARLATETAKLNATATEASAMLRALGDLIESVERFVKPTAGAE
ncbi:MAG: hypothetical protein K2Y20_11205 [Sphingomonas sp.]|nr:hypothetical protein [Sphingomonas sp.]